MRKRKLGNNLGRISATTKDCDDGTWLVLYLSAASINANVF